MAKTKGAKQVSGSPVPSPRSTPVSAPVQASSAVPTFVPLVPETPPLQQLGKAMAEPPAPTAAPSTVSTVRTKAAATAQKVLEAGLETLTLACKPYVVKVEGGFVFLKLKVGDAIVLVKAKVAALSDTPVAQKLGAYGAKAKEAVEPRILYIQAKCGDAIVLTKTKMQPLVDKYGDMKASVEKSVAEAVALAAKKYAAYQASAKALAAEKYATAQGMLVSASEPVVARAKGGYVYVSGKVGEATLFVKAKRDASKVLALESYASAVKKIDGLVTPAVAKVTQLSEGAKVKAISVIEPTYVKVKGGVITIKGKIGEAEVLLKSKVSGVVSSAADKLEPYCRPVYVKVSGGYLYITGKVGDVVLYIQTEAVKKYGAAKAKALTTYTDARKMIVDGYVAPVTSKVVETYGSAKAKALSIADGTKTKAIATLDSAKTKVKTAVADEKFKGTAAAATGGAVALGASGGAAGLVTGGTIGAAVGVMPALFTFGLSIPIGAAIGAGTGLCVGTAAGSTVGLVSGGAVGYGVQSHKEEIGSSVNGALSKASEYKNYVKGTASQSKEYLKSKLISGTGGTA